MKRVFTIAFLSTIIFTAFSASAQIKSYIGLYGGLSNPSGNYASTDYNNDQSAYAKRGVTFALDGAVYVYKSLAIGGMISFQDQGKLNANDTYNLAQGYTASYGADQATVSGYDRFHNWNVLIGPQYSVQYHKFILDVRASAGIIKVFSTPETSIQLEGVPEQSGIFYQRKSGGLLFGAGASGGIRYKLGDSWTFGVKVAYVGSGGTSVTNDGMTEAAPGRLVTKIPITELETTAGFTLSF
jgi:hypothetical protein